MDKSLSYDHSSQDPTQESGLGRRSFCNCGGKHLDSIKMWCYNEHKTEGFSQTSGRVVVSICASLSSDVRCCLCEQK